MTEPPKMLSGKDMMYITDILTISEAHIKKFREYSNILNDEQIKKEINALETLLLNQYQTLLEVISSGQ